MTTITTSSSQHLSDLLEQGGEEFIALVADKQREAVAIAQCVHIFWNSLPADMPEETRSQITLTWYASEFLEITGG